jgi:hypothetical protein
MSCHGFYEALGKFVALDGAASRSGLRANQSHLPMKLAALSGVREVSLSITDKVALEAVDGVRDVSLLF